MFRRPQLSINIPEKGRVNSENAPAVAEICYRLDGLPLAIELAAARTKTLPVPQIIARLDDRFELLKATGRGGPERHRALGAAIATSYDTLYEGERDAFCRTICPIAGRSVP